MRNGETAVEQITALRRRQIDKIETACSTAVSEALEKGEIDSDEVILAQQALLELQVGVGLSKELRSDLQSVDARLAVRIDNIIAIIMKGLFVCGGLVLTSKTIKKSRTKPALNKLAERRTLHHSAIQYALRQPPSHPFGKPRGSSAIAQRAVKAANQWLRDNLCDEDPIDDLTANKIQKILEKNPENFPPSDSWQK